MHYIPRPLLYSFLVLSLLGPTAHSADAPAMDITENSIKELKFGIAMPNLKISNSIGLVVDDN